MLPSDDAAVAAAFLERYLADQAEDRERNLDEYQELFPGHEALVAREHARLKAQGVSALTRDSSPDLRSSDPGHDWFDASADDDDSGRLVGRYRLDEVLGRGGQGTVYRAIDPRLGRDVAVKVLDRWGVLDPDALRRFEREAAVASRLEHPSISRLYDAGQDDGVPFIVMELVSGRSLSRHLRERREPESEPLPLADPPSGSPSSFATETGRICSFIADMAEALHLAHESGIVHRDVKPGNVMVTPEGRGVLLDFGLARDETPEASLLTGSGAVLGTPAYMSPEQVGGRSVDRRTDVWSLGVVLYELLTGRRPFAAPSRERLFYEITHHEPPAPSSLAPGISRDLDVITLTAVEKDLDRRYATAADLAADLRRALRGEPIAARPISVIGRTVRWAKRRPLSAALIVLLAVGIPLVTGLSTYAIITREDVLRGQSEAAADERERRLEECFLRLTRRDDPAAEADLEELLAEDPGDLVVALACCTRWTVLPSPDRARELLERLAPERQSGAGWRRLEAALLRSAGDEAAARKLDSKLGPPITAVDHYLTGVLAPVAAEPDAKRWRRAQRSFERAIRRARQARPLYHFGHANACLNTGDRDAALETAEVLGQLWPERPAALYWRGHAQMTAGDLAGAVRSFGRARELGLRDVAVLLGQALAFRKLGRVDEARAVLELAGRLSATSLGVKEHLAMVLREEGDLERSIELSHEVLEAEPERLQARAELAETLCRKGDLEAARRQAEIMDQSHAMEPEGPFLVARIRLARKDTAGAMEAARRAIDRDQGHAKSHLVLANALAASGDTEEAAASYRIVLRLEPHRAEARNNLAEMLRRSGHLDEALVQLERALVTRPGYREAHLKRLLILGDRHRNEDLLAAATQALEQAPDHVPFHWWQGLARFRLGQYASATESFCLVCEKAPEVLRARGALARSLERQGRFEEALAQFETAVRAGLAIESEARRCRQNIAMIAKVDAWRSEGVSPASAGQARAMARAARYRGRLLDAAELHDVARELDGRRAPRLQNLFRAARAALCLSARSQTLTAEDRAAWRGRGIARLREAMTLLRQQAKAGRIDASKLARRIRSWRNDPDMKGYRPPLDQDHLTEEEAAILRDLWKSS